MRRSLLFGLGLFLLLTPLVAQAQRAPQTARQARVLGTLRPEARVRVGVSDSLLSLRTRRDERGRLDARSGVRRAAYRIEARPVRGASSEAAARLYLRDEAEAYGLRASLDDLRTLRVVDGRYSRHVTFVQTVRGVPVYGREVQVNLRADGSPAMVLSAYDPALRRATLNTTPSLSPEEAAARIRTAVLAEPATLGPPDLVVYPGDVPRLAWRVDAHPEATPVEWEILVDAHTGDLVALVERSTHGLHEGSHGSEVEGRKSGEQVAVARQAASSAPGAFSLLDPYAALRSTPNARSSVLDAQLLDGTGLVFDPDPLSTAGVAYGAAGFSDNNDADSPQLTAQLREVPLRDITLENGRYVLKGPYVEITNLVATNSAYVPPSETQPVFRYTRSDPRFEAVMSYYHMDKSQRRVQALGVGRPIMQKPVRVNPHGLGTADDARFYPATNVIAFGTGGIDDGEDADVIWHEYAHALLNDSAPGLYNTTEGRSLHEGWADYWAVSYSRGLIERGLAFGDPKRIFPWDGNAGCWQGRRLDHTGFYSADRSRMGYPARSGCPAFDQIYQWGLLWATTLMEVYDALGQDVTDRLNLASHGFIGSVTAAPAYEVAAQALLHADDALYGGAHRSVLVQKLGARGYLDPGSFGPVVAHAPLASTEQEGGTREVVVEAVSGAEMATVVVRYRMNAGALQTLELTRVAPSQYAGALPLPAGAAVITYYVEVTDAMNRTVRRPATAPDSLYRFTSGPDTTPPTIRHDPPESVQAGQALPPLAAEVTDELGVSAVEVVYEVLAASGGQTDTGRFSLSLDRGAYRGSFPVTGSSLEPGGRVRYRIVARDAAAARNEGVLPAAGAFEIPVDFRNHLRQDVLASARLTGRWALSGGVYNVGPNRGEDPVSALVFDRLDLPTNAATLRFLLRHRFRLDAGAGGHLQLSADSGRTWHVLAPEGGYPATLGAPGNPMTGAAVFAGRDTLRSSFDLSPYAGQQVWLRLSFGANRVLAAGEFWSIDGATFEVATSAERFETPRTLALHPTYPNPFDARTTVSYTLAEVTDVALELYDLLGRRVAILVDGLRQAPGTYTATLDGSGLSSGVYFLRLQASGQQITRQVVRVR